VRREKIVNWTTNRDVQNRMKNEIEDYLHHLADEREIALTFDDIDGILERCLDIARVRYPE
jgi:type I restriction enzyme R subunit